MGNDLADILAKLGSSLSDHYRNLHKKKQWELMKQFKNKYPQFITDTFTATSMRMDQNIPI